MITSPRNPKIAQASRLLKRAHRDSEGSFLVEGRQGVSEALAGPGLLTLFHTEPGPLVDQARAKGVECVAVSPEAISRLSDAVSPQGVVGVSRFIDVDLVTIRSDPQLLAILCDARDPGNAGTVVRSADAAGADAVVFAGDSVDPYNPKAVRSSAGSVFHLPIVRRCTAQDAVTAARDRGMKVYAASSTGGADLYDLDFTAPVAFMFGNEAWGLPDEAASLADGTVRVPIVGKAESLNLASAATLMLFEASREGRSLSADAIIAGAAHDIRSPLTAVRSFVSLLLQNGEQMSTEDRRAMLEGIAADAEQADLILRQLIDAARLLGSGLDLSVAPVDLGEVVRAEASRLRMAEGPDLEWAGPEAILSVDPARLVAALSAMVEACVWWARSGVISARFLPESSTLEVSRGEADPPASGLEALFVPRRPGTGSGSKIGLFVARGIARAHGGELSAAVVEGSLVMRLVLPQ